MLRVSSCKHYSAKEVNLANWPMRVRGLLALGAMFTLLAVNGNAVGAFVAVKDYDEGTFATNAVDKTAASSNITLAAFKTLVGNAFDNGMGGVINFDNDPNFTGNSAPISATFAGGTKTLTITRADDNSNAIADDLFGPGTDSALSISGTAANNRKWLGFAPGDVATISFQMNSTAAPVVAWGMTAIARSSSSSGDRIYKVTITLDDASTYVFDPETVLGAVTTNDTFFGYQAPTGRTIASVRLDADPGPNGGTSTQHAWDDMGFVTVPEPSSIALICAGVLGLGIFGLKRKK